MKRHLKEGNCGCNNPSAIMPTLAGSESVNNFPAKLIGTNFECSRCEEKYADNCYESLKDSLNNVKFFFLIRFRKTNLR